MALFTIFPATGTTIYMDPVNGNNANAGTHLAPVKNFGAAWTKLPAAGGNIITATGRVTEALNYTSKPVAWYADGYVEVDGQAGTANYAGMVAAGFKSVSGFHFKNYKSSNMLLVSDFNRRMTDCTFSHVNFTGAEFNIERCLFQDCTFAYSNTDSSSGIINYCTFIKSNGLIGAYWQAGDSVTNCIFMNCPALNFGGFNSFRISFLQSSMPNTVFDYNVFATTTADTAGTEIVLAGKTFAGLQADAVLLKNPNSVKCLYSDLFAGVLNTAPTIFDSWKNSYALKPTAPVLFKSSDRIHPGARNVGYRIQAASINTTHDYLTGLDLVTPAGSTSDEAKYFTLAIGATEGVAVFSGTFGSVKKFDFARFCADLVWTDTDANNLYDEVLDFAVADTGTGAKSSFDFYLEYGNAPLPAWNQNSNNETTNLADFISRAKLVEWQKPVRIDNAGKGNADAAFNVNAPLVAEAQYFRIGFKIRRN